MKRMRDLSVPVASGTATGGTATHPARSSVIPGQTAFVDAYPDYVDTAVLDELRATEYRYLDDRNHLYLDYTGGGLPAEAQVKAHTRRVEGQCFGNPHSANPTSEASTALVERARAAVLRFFNASPEEYTAVFTPNATGACHLVGEAYPFEPGTRFVQLADNHNSVNGIREFARARGAQIDTVDLVPPELRAAEAEVRASLDRPAPSALRPFSPDGDGGARFGLFAYPAQSNFTGVQHPLEWIDLAHRHGFDVLLDAAAYAPANRIDLSRTKPDFMPVSWYKLFGYPTGLGCLVARREALARLERPWFAGGTIQAASVLGDWYHLADGAAAFEDGTVNYLSIPDVEVGLRWLSAIGMDTVHTRVRCLTGWLLDRLTEARHSTGTPLVRVYGPTSTEARGGTVAFNFLDPAGRVVDERVVARDAAAANISLRTGCFCNPGAGEAAFELHREDLRLPGLRTASTLDEVLAAVGMPTAGAIRVSVGLASTLGDVSRFLEFALSTYLDRFPDTRDLPSRLAC
ncbi:aminotransferase class V-fold PLP-dependent enzyme [Thermobifida halotolerans]|uniref:Aminotransferase class V-fold PLP-dependent enzyme n=1 Tax=Thermobifida halotolerans TaxID=483545 RepID=A0A399G0T3_9ACTN|nr:aminotransferase class V-fold PLP-dependent enzyme [Thermobifida halotolerans]UOE18510.1 aminotransferase class V-fold PLP-dependent enzyme [Thermobifida halotolerans]